MKNLHKIFLPLTYAAFAFPCTNSSELGSCISDIYTWSLSIVGIVAFVQIVFAGVLYLTAAGNATRVSEAKSKISNAILGIIILFSSYLILNTINPDLVGGSFNLPDFSGSETVDIDLDAPPEDRRLCGRLDQTCCKSSPLCDTSANLSCQGSICKEIPILPPGNCGNGVLNPGEECDGGTFAGNQTCQTRGFSGGSLSCSSCNINTSTCNAGTCTPGIDCPPPGDECVNDVDCTNSEKPVCSNGYCVTEIVPPPPNICIDNSQCPADKPVCSNGVCKASTTSGSIGEIDINAGVVRKEGNNYSATIGIKESSEYDEVFLAIGGRRYLQGWCPKLISSLSPFTTISIWPEGVCTTNEPGARYIISSQNIDNFKKPFVFTFSSPDNSRSQTFTETFDIQIQNVCPQYWFTSCSSGAPNFSETICENTTFFCINHQNSGFKYYPSSSAPTCNLANQCTTATYPASYNFETAYCYNNQWKFVSELPAGACGQ